MKHSRYTWFFVATLAVLTIGALAAFREISAVGPRDTTLEWSDDTVVETVGRQFDLAAYQAIVAADESWRRKHARIYSLAELRVRGDGRRTPRQSMLDRVFANTRRGNRAAAIAELQRWVNSNPRDGDALLWLARLLNDAGRSKESVARYRQALALANGGRQ